MELEVTFLPDGTVRARVPGDQAGTDYELAAPTLDALMRLLETSVPGLTRTTGVERHVHGTDRGHVNTHSQAR